MKRMWSKNELMRIASLMAIAQMQSGDVQNVKVFENIVDKDGHPRFVEGELTSPEKTGITRLYNKWSLSGTHLMIVSCASISNGVTLASSDTFAKANLPDWILSKITTLFSSRVDLKSANLYASDGTPQALDFRLVKGTDYVSIDVAGTQTTTQEGTIRIQFDLLIDND